MIIIRTRTRFLFFAVALIAFAAMFDHPRTHGQDELGMENINPRVAKLFPPLKIQEDRVIAHGIRKIEGAHLDLYTDLRNRSDVDELVLVFDQAVPIWQEYFSIAPDRTARWKMRAFLMEDPNRFRQAGLIPANLPEFLAGYQRGSEIWIYKQPGTYYMRHLLLHEGTHAVMDWFLNGFGSPWYSEGMAELLGLHHWEKNKLELNYKVRDRSESDYWGRIKIIRREFGQGKSRQLDDVFNTPNRAFRQVESYAWAWAACEFLSNHAISKNEFRQLSEKTQLSPQKFNFLARQLLQKNWDRLERDWQLFLADLDYGYDVAKSRLISAAAESIGQRRTRVKIRADHSWQNSNLVVNSGDRLKITCDSRFQVGKTSKTWPSEANGITLEYFRHRPLGQLMAGVLIPDAKTPADQITGLLDPFAVGTSSEIKIARDGKLCFRINESPSHLGDNQGILEVIVEQLE